eukprot:COSAG06_NODE_27324_length_595_cov_1.568548_1_plen_112_part_01
MRPDSQSLQPQGCTKAEQGGEQGAKPTTDKPRNRKNQNGRRICWHLLLPLERRARISSSQASVARDAMGSQACWLPERRLRAAATPSARCRARSGHRWRWLVAAVAASAACA